MNNYSYMRCIKLSDNCNEFAAHEDIIKKVRSSLPRTEYLYELAELFKVFSDVTRVQILCLLAESEMCVCDIVQLMNMSQSAISHQLRILKQSKLVKYRREGKTVYYSLADSHVKTIFSQGLEHIME